MKNDLIRMVIGKIYKIVYKNNTDICYVGSTFNTLEERWKGHVKSFNGWLKTGKNELSIFPYYKDYGVENFHIELITQYKVIDKAHLESKEQLWINRLNCCNNHHSFEILKKRHYYINLTNLYKFSLNYYIVFDCSKLKKIYRQKPEAKEKEKEYRQKPEVKEKMKTYRQKPEVKEKKNERAKEYRQKPEVKEKIKAYFQKPEVKKKINERVKAYQQKPEVKEKIKERVKAYNQKPEVKVRANERARIKVKCPICAKEMNQSSLSYHKKTQHNNNHSS